MANSTVTQLTQYPVQQSVARDNGVIATPDYPLDVQNTEVSVFQDRFQEKRTLLLVSVIHFICVLPNAVYTLCYEIDNYQITYGNVVASFTLMWLSILRSLVTPCIFTYMNK